LIGVRFGGQIDDHQSTIDDRQSTIDNRRSTIDGRQSTVDNRRSTIDGRQSTIDNQTMGIDQQIDQLYQLPLGEFTAARNSLAKSLTAADKDQAARVQALAKPTVVPWTANQLFWRERAVYERLMKAGAALRDAQLAALGGQPAAGQERKSKSVGPVKPAAASHRQALAEAVRQATRLATASGVHADADELSRTLESLSLSSPPPEHPGRLTEAVRPAGFEALAGLAPSATQGGFPPHARPKSPSTLARAKEEAAREQAARARAAAAERKREEARAAERKQLELAVTNAERALEQAKAAEVTARLAYDKAGEDREAAAARLADARRFLTSKF
jgi:hypothetical protein